MKMIKTMYMNATKQDPCVYLGRLPICYSVIRNPLENEVPLKLTIEVNEDRVIGHGYTSLEEIEESKEYDVIYGVREFGYGFGNVEYLKILNVDIIKKIEILDCNEKNSTISYRRCS